MTWILVVEDDPPMANLLRRTLVQEGYGVVCASSPFEAQELLDTRPFRLMLLDLKLGDGKSFQLGKDVADKHSISVVFVSGSDDVTDKVVALELGAEDYVVKPFDEKELLARIRVVLRRQQQSSAPSVGGKIEVYLFDRFELNPKTQILTDADGTAIPLSRFEYQLLKLLLSRGYEPITREQISLQINRRPHVPTDRTIDVVVAKLRRKLGSDVIETVRGEGYRMGIDVTQSAKLDPPVAAKLGSSPKRSLHGDFPGLR